jgi:Glycosyl transferase family 2
VTSGTAHRKLTRAIAAFRSGGLRGLTRAVRDRLVAVRAERTRGLRRAWRRTIDFGIRPHLLRPQVTHVHGPLDVTYRAEDLLVLCVVRNGALYVESFMDHYARMGVAHSVFLDNGSTDATVEMLCDYPRVTVLRTDAPYHKYENTMKRMLAERFSRGRWHLCADIDELFDYPFSAQLPLAGLLGYLNARGFTAVVAQLLDMFSDVPIAAIESLPGDRLKQKYQYFDISMVDRRAYEWSEPRRPEIKMHWGGIRRAVFGTNNGLTKAALVCMNGQVRPFVEWHQATRAVLADITCVLMHYPFVSGFRDKVLDAVRTGRYGMTTTDEYVAYARGLASNPNLSLMRPSARRFTGLEELIADGFVVASDDYRRWVSAYAQRRQPA